MKQISIVIATILLAFALKANDTTQYIAGYVKQKSDNAPMSAAVIKITGYNTGVVSDATGYYKLFIADSLVGKRITVQFSYIGYEQLDTIICFKGNQQLNVYLWEYRAVIRLPMTRPGEVCYIFGRLKTESGNDAPLPDATVTIVGTGITTRADAKGNYRLDWGGYRIPQKLTIAVSCVGYRGVEKTVRFRKGKTKNIKRVNVLLMEVPDCVF